MTLQQTMAVVGATVVLLAGAARDAGSQQFVTTGRDTLRGLPGVEVLVEPLQPELERAGLTGGSLQAEIESLLRAKGVLVFASQAANTSPAKPYLYLHLNTLTLPLGQGQVVNVQLHLRQTLRSAVTGSNVVNAMTWDRENVIVVPAARIQDVRSEVRSYVDGFIEDWLAVH